MQGHLKCKRAQIEPNQWGGQVGLEKHTKQPPPKKKIKLAIVKEISILPVFGSQILNLGRVFRSYSKHKNKLVHY